MTSLYICLLPPPFFRSFPLMLEKTVFVFLLLGFALCGELKRQGAFRLSLVHRVFQYCIIKYNGGAPSIDARRGQQ